MNTARIENLIRVASLTWRRTLLLASLGLLIGLALAMASRLPVS